jgi:hypothetical protein
MLTFFKWLISESCKTTTTNTFSGACFIGRLYNDTFHLFVEQAIYATRAAE